MLAGGQPASHLISVYHTKPHCATCINKSSIAELAFGGREQPCYHRAALLMQVGLAVTRLMEAVKTRSRAILQAVLPMQTTPASAP